MNKHYFLSITLLATLFSTSIYCNIITDFVYNNRLSHFVANRIGAAANLAMQKAAQEPARALRELTTITGKVTAGNNSTETINNAVSSLSVFDFERAKRLLTLSNQSPTIEQLTKIGQSYIDEEHSGYTMIAALPVLYGLAMRLVTIKPRGEETPEKKASREALRKHSNLLIIGGAVCGAATYAYLKGLPRPTLSIPTIPSTVVVI